MNALSYITAGGVGGGDFWTGARQGLITAGLNHALHRLVEQPEILIEDNSGGDIELTKFMKELENVLKDNGFPNSLTVKESTFWSRLFSGNIIAKVNLRKYWDNYARLKYEKTGKIIGGHASYMKSKYATVYANILSKKVPLQTLINITVHELGHAVFGFTHTNSGIMQAKYVGSKSFTSDQQIIIILNSRLWGYQ